MLKQTFETKGCLKNISFTNSAAQGINNWKRQALRTIHRPRAYTKEVAEDIPSLPLKLWHPLLNYSSMLFLTHSCKALTSRLSNCWQWQRKKKRFPQILLGNRPFGQFSPLCHHPLAADCHSCYLWDVSHGSPEVFIFFRICIKTEKARTMLSGFQFNTVMLKIQNHSHWLQKQIH